MMMLPPVGGSPKVERRSRARRVNDRVEPTAAPDAPEAAVDAPFSPEPEREAVRRPPRKGGRRASDRAQEAEAGPAKAARAPKPFAPLVAQIIANVMGLEQTRVRRRGSLAEADALYRPKRERAKRSRGEA